VEKARWLPLGKCNHPHTGSPRARQGWRRCWQALDRSCCHSFPGLGKVFACIDAAEKGSGRGWELNCGRVNPPGDPPQPHGSCRNPPTSSIPALRTFTFKGGGQGGGRVPGADPADGQVTLHAAVFVQHAGVHGRAWGKETGTAAISQPWHRALAEGHG